MAAILLPFAKMGLDLGMHAIANNNSDKSFRDGWTQQQLGPLSSANPGRNIMIVCVKHDASKLTGVQHQALNCQCPSGATQHYDCYIFDEGVFLHQGGGGFSNWAFCGNFVRNGDTVTFKKPGT